MNRLPLFLLALLSFLPTAWSQFEFAADGANSRKELVAEVKAIAPGATFSVALKLDHPKGWHSYYQNSGGVELPPAIKWTLPPGFTAGPIQWPAPTVKKSDHGTSFIYTGSPVFLVDITAPANLAADKPISLTANATWQICSDDGTGCIPEEGAFTLNLPVAAAAEPEPAVAELFTKARASQPRKAAGWQFSAATAGAQIILRATPDKALESAPEFIPAQLFVKPAGSSLAMTRDGDGWQLRLDRVAKDELGTVIPQGNAISGVLLVSKQALSVPETVISKGGTAASAPQEYLSFVQYLPILGGMLLGGLILNLMPCVFPVIGLKIMGFAQQAGEDRRKITLHGITFALGIFSSFAVLSAILYTARESFGWGYQLQNPWVVLALMLLMFVLALNMFGVFEMGVAATSVGGSLQSKQGFAGSFFSGALATVVATPCSGPFLGAAIGAAITLPALQFFGAFAAMAIGLALPYLILSIFPKLIAALPRPGAWMESFKQAMSFLLFATTGYLLWVYATVIDLENMLSPIFGLSAIAVAAWIYGRWNLPHLKASTRLVAVLLTLSFASGGLYLAKPPGKSAIAWETWSEKRVEALLNEGKPVYIDFTASWCATCQVNKKRAYPKQVVELMSKKGVVALKADKSKPNPEIEAALKKLGRTAIPVNVLIAPGKPPVILPNLLSAQDVTDALEKL